MYYVVFILSISIVMPSGVESTKNILETSKLKHCIEEGIESAKLLSRPDYRRHIESFEIECKPLGRHDV